MKARNIIIALAMHFKGDWGSIYNAIQNKTDIGYNEYTEEDLDKIDCITILDEDYPEILKNSFQPPFVLFYAGDISLLKADKKIAILGTNNPDKIYLDFTESFITNLPKGNVIISGGSFGICDKAIKTALKTDKKVITVLGHGIDYKIGDSANGDLILSEYPFDTSPSNDKLAKRNIVIATLSNKVCSIQISQHSGSLVAINQALALGKDVYCVPNLTDAADENNKLIDEGAYTLTLSTTF